MNARVPTERADVVLVAQGLAASREKAQAMILAGSVQLAGRRIAKPSERVAPDAPLTVAEQPPYVSRGGFKLVAAMDAFQVNAAGLVAIDVGASTGGFTDVLLQRGAALVYAVDVGYGQLADKIRHDSRVIVMERINARLMNPGMFEPLPTLAVMDVSFISIKLILPVLRGIMGESGRVVTLVKPQFEAGREKVGKKGIVRDSAVHAEVLRGILEFTRDHGWSVNGIIPSPILGQTGNKEFLMDIEFSSDESDSRKKIVNPLDNLGLL
ncbi:TlyA family rRNA (cytidine-2'-O)-methyltransferase [Clostridia bacterium]|nr:TlyA family rRNA (cytidine-2'-O)-methyltransferase [Clostridia bacterium]